MLASVGHLEFAAVLRALHEEWFLIQAKTHFQLVDGQAGLEPPFGGSIGRLDKDADQAHGAAALC